MMKPGDIIYFQDPNDFVWIKTKVLTVDEPNSMSKLRFFFTTPTTIISANIQSITEGSVVPQSEALRTLYGAAEIPEEYEDWT